MNEAPLQGPAWDLSTEYSSPTAPEIDHDLEEAGRLFDEIEALNDALGDADSAARVKAAQAIFKLRQQAGILLQTVSAFANGLLSVNGRDADALNLQGRLQSYQKRMGDASEPLSQFCDLAPDEENLIKQILYDLRLRYVQKTG